MNDTTRATRGSRRAASLLTAALFVAATVLIGGSTPGAQAQGTGARPTLVLLCRYADVSVTPTLGTEWVQQTWTGDPANSFDGVVRETSYGAANLQGSRVFGWFTIAGKSTDYTKDDREKLAGDCVTAARNGGVDTSPYQYLFIYWNASVPAVVGGVTLRTDLTGFSALAPATGFNTCMVSDGAFTGTALAQHELGHLYGGDHTNSPGDALGPGGAGNAANWDQAWFDPAPGPYVANTFGASNRDQMGFVPTARRAIFAGGTQKVTLVPVNDQRASGTVLVEIPVSATVRYVVSVRTTIGLDAKGTIRGGEPRLTPGVVVEKTDTSALFITQQKSGAGGEETVDGVWRAGQTFTDAATNVSVRIDRFDDTGADVTITGAAGPRLEPRPGFMP